MSARALCGGARESDCLSRQERHKQVPSRAASLQPLRLRFGWQVSGDLSWQDTCTTLQCTRLRCSSVAYHLWPLADSHRDFDLCGGHSDRRLLAAAVVLPRLLKHRLQKQTLL